MSVNILPISNIINVSITNTPSGLAERNVNSLGLFTTESPSNIDPFRIYISATQVAEDFGTSSVTAQMANAIFAQTPNLRSGDGRLVIIPMVGSVSATQGDTVSADLTANLAAILAVTDGDLRVTIDGTNVDLTNVDFSAATDMDDVATILDDLLPNVIVTAAANVLTFKSKKVGDDSDVIYLALPAGVGTDLAGVGLLNAAGSTPTSGVDSSGETLLAAIARIEDQVSFTGIITNLEIEDDVINTTADAIQATDRMWLHHGSSNADIAGIGTTIKTDGNKKTRYLLYTTSPQTANLMKSAYAGRAFSVNFNGTNTSQTMNLKQLVTIEPDPGITQTLYDAAEIAGVDLFVSYDGVASVFSTGGNDFFDNQYNDLALKFALETSGFNFLRQTNTKVPQTEPGMNGLKSAYSQVMERFVRVGAVAPGSWTASETFGDPEIFKENILNKGYYVFSIPIVDQSSVDRAARKAPLAQIAVKRAGAIHTSDVIVLVND
jgi:hypothetical protein